MIAKSILLLTLMLPLVAEAGGSVKGLVRYTGEKPPIKKLAIAVDSDVCGTSSHSEDVILGKRGELKNVVVYISGRGLPLYKNISPEPAVELVQEKCQFLPRMTFLMPGQDLHVINKDGILQNFHTESRVNAALNRAQPASMRELSLKFLRPEIFSAVCDVHSWMKAWVIVKEHPYYTITNEKGEYELSNIPAGDYVLHFWHEKMGMKNQIIKIEEGQSLEVPIKMGIY